jgi:hypothetical protein
VWRRRGSASIDPWGQIRPIYPINKQWNDLIISILQPRSWELFFVWSSGTPAGWCWNEIDIQSVVRGIRRCLLLCSCSELKSCLFLLFIFYFFVIARFKGLLAFVPKEYPMSHFTSTSSASTPLATAHPLGNYNFGVKDAKPEKDTSVHARLLRMEKMYHEEGMRRSGDFHTFTGLSWLAWISSGNYNFLILMLFCIRFFNFYITVSRFYLIFTPTWILLIAVGKKFLNLVVQLSKDFNI